MRCVQADAPRLELSDQHLPSDLGCYVLDDVSGTRKSLLRMHRPTGMED